MFRPKYHPQGATLCSLKSLLKTSCQYHAAKHRTHTRSRALLATHPYTKRHAGTEPGLYNESNQ